MPPPLATPNNLPQQITTFVGRERELAEVSRLLEGHRLLTLTGSGGTGKTRLAIEAALRRSDRYNAGIWFIDLASLADPALVPQTFANTLRVPEEPGRSIIESVMSYLETKDVLLIVDNTEHVTEATASMCETIIANCPLIQIMATGRSVLDIEGERTYRVPSMSMPDPKVNYTPRKLEEFEAVKLFIDRATKSNPEFKVSRENTPTLARICHRIDGIPLAIELAAARVGTMDLSELSAKIDERFQALSSGGHGFLPRQQTLRAMIAWSYDLLSDAEQQLLRRVSVFSNGWSREAAEAVCGDPEGYGLSASAVLMALEDLLDKAMVQFDDGTARYRLLETVRTYAKDALDETLESDSIRDRHLMFFADYARSSEPHINGPDAKTVLDKLDVEYENVRTALDWGLKGGEIRIALELANSLSTYYQVRGMFEEALTVYGNLVAKADDRQDVHVADAHAAMGVLLFRQGKYGGSTQRCTAALEIYESLQDLHGMAKALNTLGVIALQLKEYEEAEPHFRRALELFRQIGEERRVAMALNNLGILAVHLGDIRGARRLYEEALEVNQRAGNRRFEAGNLTNLADLALREGDALRSRALARRACSIHLELEDIQNLQETFEVLAAAELKCGRAYIAAILFASKEAMMTDLGLTVAPFVFEEYKKNVETTKKMLGEETFRAAFTEGRAMSPAEAFTASLEEF